MDDSGECLIAEKKNTLNLNIPYPCDFGTNGPAHGFSIEYTKYKSDLYFTVIGELSWNQEYRSKCGNKLTTLKIDKRSRLVPESFPSRLAKASPASTCLAAGSRRLSILSVRKAMPCRKLPMP